VASSKLVECVAVTRGAARDFDRFDQFVVLARGRHQAGEEFFGDNAPSISLRRQFDSAFEHEQRQWDLGAWIGVRDRAANRAATANLRVTDPRQGGGEQRLALGQFGPRQQRGLPYAGADSDNAVPNLDLRQLGQMHDID
jgi:hypothetical protein